MTKYPELFRAIIALIKFADLPPIPAIGYAATCTDDPTITYFACPIERKGYAWELVAKWDYLEDIAPSYLCPSWEKREQPKKGDPNQ